MATNVDRQGPQSPAPHRPPVWARAAGIGVPVAAVTILVALKPEIVRGTFSSAQSMLRVGAVVAGWVAFSWCMRRVVSNPFVRTAVIAVPATVLLWMNVAPYFEDDVKVTGRFPERVGAAGGTSVPSASPPVRLSTGRFRGLDGHRGSGEASVFRQPGGSHVVAFGDLSVSSVPDPVVYLVPGADREGIEGAVRLGRFEPGRDSYEIPPGFDVDRPLTVMIWCQRFSVPVAGASQSPA
ncbi:MAG TPA: DM13 domain-containing protein [Acidimicrobiales bacterium]|nr:DM13 domain-containing protein [Acidimicrobiales bacterium]